MGTKGWIIFGALTAIILGGLVYVSQSNRLDVSDVDTSSVLGPSDDSGNIGDHAKGNLKSKNVLIEYGDFQCPGCAGVNPEVQELVEKLDKEIVFVYRHLPLSSIHPNALAAATAAEAAGKQDKFWQMHKLLFVNQSDWQDVGADVRQEVFTGYAKQLELDIDRFESDYDSGDVKKKITFDMALASKDKATGTPHFILNGEKMPEEITSVLGQGQLDTVEDWIKRQID